MHQSGSLSRFFWSDHLTRTNDIWGVLNYEMDRNTIHPNSLEGFMGLKVFSHHAQSGCFKHEIEVAIESLKVCHEDR